MKLFKRKKSIRSRLNGIIHHELDHLEEAEETGEEYGTERLNKCLNMKTNLIEKIWTIIKDILAIFVPLCFYGTWLNKGMKFEEEGVMTSGTFKSFTSKLNPRKW